MTFTEQINEEIKLAMKAKDQVSLRGLRAIKAELIILNTKEGGIAPTAEDELAALVRMAKQRRDSMEIFNQQNRSDLALKEKEELEVIERFMPKQLSVEEINEAVKAIIAETGASGMKDMGKVMGLASQKLKGMADGKVIAEAVKTALAS